MPYGKGTYGSQVGRPPKAGRAANAAARRLTKKVAKSAKGRGTRKK